ncbi:ATP-binding protein [Butyrivibrio sp. WCD3002]|uniref:ATP-binding protein n=1 Tax=Butyrivibrio sp. WCD3002 TaxID=1280676 RepID=UPI000415B3D0|nr:ATP-binding protein [Butyrivibrio sp. WCD3002]
MEIKRDNYLKKLINKRNNGLIKVITGVRRCGKSYLLFNLYYDYLINEGVSKDCIISVPLDDDDYVECCDPQKLSEYIKSRITDSNKQYYVFIDEAQYAITKEEMKNPDVPIRLYGVLNGLLRKKNVDVYVTGSNSKFLSSDILTEFRGRGDEIHIAPLSFSEYYPAAGKDKYDAWQEYLFYGGLPHILAEPDNESKEAYLERLNSEIYIRDIVERYEIRDAASMETLMKVIASAVGSLTNAQKISDTFNSNGDKSISMPTISNYLKYLTESFVIQKGERYDIKGRKYIGTPSKYYYTDIGLRNALLNFRQFEETHLMENAIYNELIYRGYKVDVGVVEIRVSEDGKKVRKQLEVDFVVNQGSKRYYIQSAFELPNQEKIDQEQASLIKIPDSFKKIIITSGNSSVWRNEQGITIMGLFDFLLNEDSLDY